MAGETNVFQYTQALVDGPLHAAATQQISAGLAATQNWLHAAGAIWLFATIFLALGQNLSFGRLLSRIMRVLLVTALLTPPLYNKFIVTPVITDFPALIAKTFGASTGAQTIPAQFVAIFNSVENLSATLRAQATGIAYWPERVMIGIAELLCKVFLVPVYALSVCLQVFQLLVVLAGTVALIFYLWDKTQSYAEAWAGKLVGSLMATMLLSAVLQIVLQLYTGYMGLAVTAFSHTAAPAVSVPDVYSEIPGFGDHAVGAVASLNISEGIEMLFNLAAVFLIGIFMAIIAVVIGFAIGRSAGFNAGNVVRNVSRGFR